jgi:type III secretion protein C
MTAIKITAQGRMSVQGVTRVRLLRHKFFGLMAATAAVTAAFPAMASPPPFPQRMIDIVGRGQSGSLILLDLFGQAGLKVKVSSAVNCPVMGKFKGSAAEIWRQVASACNLVSYYDGSVVRVYDSKEIQTRTLSATSPSEVVREARQLGLLDANNKVTAGSAHVTVSGVPIVIEQVERIAGRAMVKPAAVTPVKSSPAMTPVPRIATTVTGADIISPSAPRPSQTGARASVASAAPAPALAPGSSFVGGPRLPVRSTVQTTASARYPYETRVFYLRYASAQDQVRDTEGSQVLVHGVVSILTDLMADGNMSSTVSTSGDFEAAKHPLSRGVGISENEDEAERPDQEQRYTRSSNANTARIVANVANNAVIVRARPEEMPTFESLIASLDIEKTSVEVEATIIDLNTTRMKELGIDFSVNTGGLSAVFGGSVGPVTSGPSGQLGGSYVTGPGSVFNLRINALERSGAARVVTKARIPALDNLEAVYSQQEEVYLPISSERSAALERVRAGLILRVTPKIFNDGGELRTQINLEIQDGTVVRDADGAPRVQRSALNTVTIVKQGEAAIVGGMTVMRQYDYKSGTPGLSKVPILGNAFKKRNKGSERIERIFLISPRIMTQNSGGNAVANATPAIPIEVLEGRKPPKRKSK